MGKKFSKSFVAKGVAFVVLWSILVTGVFGTGVDGYLPRVGPPPLRYRPLQPLNLSILPPLPADDAKPGDESGARSAAVSLAPFRDSAFGGVPVDLSQGTGLLSSGLAPSYNPDFSTFPGPISATNHMAAETAASDLLGISPGMLIDYFKPIEAAQAPTNAASVIIVAPIQFAPPAPPPSESTASYQAP